jgi:hypothetical protein
MRRKAIQKADEFRFRRERVLPVPFIVEVVFNGSYLVKANEGGLLGGAIQAVAMGPDGAIKGSRCSRADQSLDLEGPH